jgi:aminoglycoside/choline kinase family phosphotransferase
VARLLRQYGIHAPQVYAADFEQGFLLIEDLGDTLYSKVLPDKEKGLPLYAEAEQCLLKMALIPVESVGLPLYDREKLQQEMNLFPQWFVEKLLGAPWDATARNLMGEVHELLIDNALEQPQVVVHRDFHCRNLLVVENNNPGVIDFQDAVLGPVTYDLVSLYRDCYIGWPAEDVLCWVRNYFAQLCDQHILHDIDGDTFVRWFDWMGLQRHIKVLGIFSRLFLRDEKENYLQDLSLVIHYTLSVAEKYPEFLDFVRWFRQTLLPLAQQQGWYREISL